MRNKPLLSESISSRQLAHGDETLFSKLYNLYWEMLYGYVIRVLQDKEDTMDVVQETFISVWQQRKTLADVGSVKSYLFSIARYKALRHIRLNIQKRDHLPSLLQFFNNYQESPETLLVSEELQQIIDAKVASLPPKMREVFILSREENLSYKEIAERLNISDKTVKKQISNSLKILRLETKDGCASLLWLLLLLRVL